MLSIFLTLLLTQAEPPKATLDPTELPIPFQRYTTADKFGRTITFYLSRTAGVDKNAKLPIVLFVYWRLGQSVALLSARRAHFRRHSESVVAAGEQDGPYPVRGKAWSQVP